ncbi:hypothetical protein AIR33_20790 [Salmonella enterica]|nr:hypothetical protein [Salmonella enterica]EEJ9028861.1 hypothetical protein [Salmonella enterica subsp. enterica]
MCKSPEHTLIGRSESERQATLKIARAMLQNGIDRSTVRSDWCRSATNPPFLTLPAWRAANTGGAVRYQSQALPASHSD